MRLDVTRVRPELWQRLREIRLAALADVPEMFGSTLERELAFAADEWRRRAARPATFLAARGGVDVGLAGVYDFDGEWCVMGMWIAAPARGTGVVEALLAECESTVVSAGAERVALWVMADNPRGLRAYARLGYVGTGERQHVRDGRDQLLMVKPLPAEFPVLPAS